MKKLEMEGSMAFWEPSSQHNCRQKNSNFSGCLRWAVGHGRLYSFLLAVMIIMIHNDSDLRRARACVMKARDTPCPPADFPVFNQKL